MSPLDLLQSIWILLLIMKLLSRLLFSKGQVGITEIIILSVLVYSYYAIYRELIIFALSIANNVYAKCHIYHC